MWKLRVEIHLRPCVDFYEIRVIQKTFVSTLTAECCAGIMKCLQNTDKFSLTTLTEVLLSQWQLAKLSFVQQHEVEILHKQLHHYLTNTTSIFSKHTIRPMAL